MNTLLNIIIFITGTFFGSFFTLAVYRIPRKEDILIKHSYCPNCKHKLGFLDLFPVLSYLFLGGKCRYCKNRIRPRYFILEILSGITFLIIFKSLKINFYDVKIEQMMYLAIFILYISILFITAGIDKENIDVFNSVTAAGLIFEILYIIYLCTLGNINVYQYIIYAIFLIVILIISAITKHFRMKEEYFTKIAYLALYIIIFSGSTLFILTTIMTLISIIIHKMIAKNKKIPIAFYLSVCNIILLVSSNFFINFIK